MEFQCDVCAKTFQTKQMFKKHKIYHIDEKITCLICNKTFANKQFLRIHSASHGEKEHKCDQCDKIYYQRQHLHRHKQIHKKKEISSILESLQEFEKIPRVSVTEKIVPITEINEKIVHIDDCRNRKSHKLSLPLQGLFLSQIIKNTNIEKGIVDKILDDLLALTFTNVKNRTCNICNKTLESKKYLQEHIENHFLPSQIECTICLKVMSQHSLHNHMKKHTGARLEDGQGNYVKLDIPQEKKKEHFICQICDKQFKLKKTLNVHIKSLHKVNSSSVGEELHVNCEKCSKKFTNYELLFNHIKVAHGTHSCKYCKKIFGLKSNLKRHIKSAHENINCHCEECDKVFSRKEDLSLHVKVNHTNFNCKLCKTTISGEKFFKKHLKVNHESNCLLKMGIKSRKPISHCTPEWQKNKSKKYSQSLKTVTGDHVPFRKLVFSNVCKDNEDLKEILTNFFQFKPFKEEDIVRLSTTVGLSDNKTYQVIQEIKSQFGNAAVDCNSAKALANRKKIFNPFYRKEKIKVLIDGNLEDRWLVYTPYPAEVSKLRCLLRGEDPNSVEHYLSDDHGKDFYKLVMTQIPKKLENHTDESYANETELNSDLLGTVPSVEEQFSKFKMNEPQLTKKFKKHSVKNATIFAAVSAPESYDTLSTIYEKTNINSMDPTANIGDMKIQNIKTGKQNHSSRYPCIYGDGCRKMFYPKRKKYKPTKKDLQNEGEWIKGTDMDFEKMEKMNNKWVADTDSNENKLKNVLYQNQKHPSILKPKNKKVKVLVKVPPGGLHVVLLGAGNDIYDAIETNLPIDKQHLLGEFEKFIGAKRPNYNGTAWEGNQLHKIIKDKSLTKLEELLPEDFQCFVEAFRLLDDLNMTLTRSKMLTKKCTSKEQYIKECNQKTDNFMECFDYLKFTYGTSKTVKIHTIESHLVDYVKLTSKTLGSLDQCIEAVHQYFNQRMTASNYKIKNKSSEKHGEKLLQLVNHFNSYNLYN